ncbi:MAG TPA: zinc-dependent alcohol dehydrogenase family protein, partial [Rhabdochlamydiaceae bacterium]|nr:zinc-dependent alcohol dehydrogenase family protein [Rhabdochlamydiaceae bacterium]
DLPRPHPQKKEVLIKISCCGICRTDLHVIEGDLPQPKLPLIPGHQIVGKIVELGSGAERFKIGDRVGVAWLGKTCGKCEFCKENRENLCDNGLFTGYQLNGGYAEYCSANEDFIFPIPEGFSDIQAAPLLCAGFIGYRSYRMAKDAKNIGFYGFGSSAHILIQIARYEGRKVFTFSRKGNQKNQDFAKKMGAYWAGDSETMPPELLDAAIIFAPVGSLIPVALKALRKGGSIICAGIHMSDIPSFPYSLLWGEREIKSVANLTREDGEQLLELAPKIPIKTDVITYPLETANEALKDFKEGKIEGTAVLVI